MLACPDCAEKNNVCVDDAHIGSGKCNFCRKEQVCNKVVLNEYVESLLLVGSTDEKIDLLESVVVNLRNGKGVIDLHLFNRLAAEIVKSKYFVS